MAKLIPHSSPSDIDLQPERIVAERLCTQLPKDALVYHSYPWLRKDRDLDRPGAREVLREGEADFVILHPRYGIMIVEVKGGQMFYDTVRQRWSRQGETHAVKDPFDQSSKNLRAFEKLLKERSFGSYGHLPFARTRCVVFPNCDYTGTMPPGADRRIVFGASHLESLGTQIDELFQLQAFVPKERLSEDTLNGIKSSLDSTFRLLPALWREVEDQDKVLLRLTEQQSQVLDFIHGHARATIKGVAGSGKTYLAMAKARRFAEEGKKVLFLCFTRMLAEWLEATLPGKCMENLTVVHYHKLCFDWVHRAKLGWPSNVNSDWWTTHAPRLLESAIDQLPERFDAVVVDEAQDFLPAWWDTVELIQAQPMEGPFYVFYDPAQQLYHGQRSSLPDLGQHFDLTYNCRNTVAIAQTCGKVIKQTIATKNDANKGTAPQWILAPTEEEQRTAIQAQMKRWIDQGKLQLSQVAILTAYPVDNGSCSGAKFQSGYPMTEDLSEWRANNAVLITTIGKFKGLEADAIILGDVPTPDPDAGANSFSPAHLYVACSRAKHYLTVVAKAAGVKEWLAVP